MASYEEQVGEPQATDKEYVEIIRSEVKCDPRYITETGEPAKITYYCRDCKARVTPKRIGKKFRFSCGDCKYDPVAFGTEDAVSNYYRLTKLSSATEAG
jgi:predicted SprT family Zn-dependent metalloprotease